MADKTSIEWTDASWNPIRGTKGRWTCSKISPGCDHCYASTMNRRFGGTEYPYVGEPSNDAPHLDTDVLSEPSRWKKPRRIFVCSMNDLYAENVPAEWIDEIFDEMLLNPRHTFQVFTKRPGRMLSWWQHSLWRRIAAVAVLPAHIWLGTTIELDRYSWRARKLIQIPASVHFISAEPLLGPLPSLDLECIEWVITGGESGAHARPMHPDWGRELRDRCVEAGISFFFKQWGTHKPVVGSELSEVVGRMKAVRYDGSLLAPDEVLSNTDAIVHRAGKHNAGRLLDEREWNQMPEVD